MERGKEEEKGRGREREREAMEFPPFRSVISKSFSLLFVDFFFRLRSFVIAAANRLSLIDELSASH